MAEPNHPPWPDRLWMFLIDTDSYAGNFAYDMCAYMTGRVAEGCEDDEMAASYREDMGVGPEEEYNDHIVDMPIDRQCQPADCWVTPGAGACNSVAIFMDRRPTEQEVETMIARARKYADRVARPDILGKILGFRLVLRETTESQVASFPTS